MGRRTIRRYPGLLIRGQMCIGTNSFIAKVDSTRRNSNNAQARPDLATVNTVAVSEMICSEKTPLYIRVG